ncbi:hypothetical protein JNB11_02865 [Kocuria palustris]|nr:hypothetical protein [Kocuria palustris]
MADKVASALNGIHQQLLLMQQCLADGNLMQALKHVSNFLNELRTLLVTPKQYYEIYMAAFDQLEIVSSYLASQPLGNHQRPFLDSLYELVQYAANIIPRLYLMMVVGTTYMQQPNAPVTDLMKDLIEMCKGVQHPIRGLFLRYYLSQRTKNLLPISTDEEFRATIDFLVSNFIEMNKLWVRLQHQGHSSEREQRIRERNELKILVGSQLVRISQVIDEYQGDLYLAIGYYRDRVFPIITQQIVACRDVLAQTYLIDVLIQIFPEEFHFATLDGFLAVMLQVHPNLNKSELVNGLVARFVKYQQDKAEKKQREEEEAQEAQENETQDNETQEDEKKESDEKETSQDETSKKKTEEKEIHNEGTEEIKPEEKEDKSDGLTEAKVEDKTTSNANKDDKSEEGAEAKATEKTTDTAEADDKRNALENEAKAEESSAKDEVSKRNDDIKPSVDESELNKDTIDQQSQVADSQKNKDDAAPPKGDLSASLAQLSLTDDLLSQLFAVFWDFYLQLFELDPEMPASEHLQFLAAIIQILLAFDVDHEQHRENMAKVYEFSGKHLEAGQLVDILVAPLAFMQSPADLKNSQYQRTLFDQLDIPGQRRVAHAIISRLLTVEAPFQSTEEIDGVFQYLSVLICEQPEQTTSVDLGLTTTVKINDQDIPQSFLDTQEQLCKILHLIKPPGTPIDTVSALQYTRRMWLNKLKQNIVFTYPTLVETILYHLQVFGFALKRVPQKKRSPTHIATLKNQFKQVLVILNELYMAHPERLYEILQLYLHAATVADNVGFSDASFEYINQALVLYEEQLSLGLTDNYYASASPHDALGGSLALYMLVIALVNSVGIKRSYDKDAYVELAAKVTHYGLRLLRKQDQCRAIYTSAHLWWWTDDYGFEGELFQDGKRVLECLQKSLRVADSCMDPYLLLKLFIEILNRSIIFALYGAPVDVPYINGLLLLIRTNITELEADKLNSANADTEAVLFHILKRIFSRTCEYIVQQQDDGRLVGVMV